MRISDVIQKLEEIKELHGDLRCFRENEPLIDNSPGVKDLVFKFAYFIEEGLPSSWDFVALMGKDINKCEKILLFNDIEENL